MGSADLSSPTTAAAFAIFASDAVTITRGAKVSPPLPAPTQIYSGSGDIQEGGGSTYLGPAGAVEVSDAVLIVSASTASDLPDVQVGDVVKRTSDGKTFTVKAVSSRTWALPHLELQLKRGGVQMRQNLGRS